MYSAKKSPMKKLQISVQPDFWILLSVSLIFIPIPWILSWLVAASIHEIFHIITLRISGYSFRRLNIGAYGAGIEADLESNLKMALCALAGPISGFFLLPFIHIIPRVVICGLLQSLCNLIPIYPLDGGRIITGIIFTLFKKETATKIGAIIEKSVRITIFATVCYGVIRFKLGIFPRFILYILFAKKYLANHDQGQYNIHNII